MSAALLQPLAWCAAFWTALLVYERHPQSGRPLRFALALALGAALAHAGWLLLHAPVLWPALRLRPSLLFDPSFGFCVLFVPLGLLLLERSSAAFASLPIALAIAKLGCIAAGCCWGTPTAAPWAVAGLHPTPLYEIAGLLVLAALAGQVEARFTASLVLGGLGALRLLVEPLRAQPPLGAPLVSAAAIAAAWLVFGVSLAGYRAASMRPRKQRLRREQAPPREHERAWGKQHYTRTRLAGARAPAFMVDGGKRYAPMMGQRPGRSSMLLLALALAACGSSVRVASAGPLNWEGTLEVEILGFEPLAVIGGGVSTVEGPGGGTFLQTLRLAASRGGITGTAMVPITDPLVQAQGIASVRATASLGTGSFAPISGGTGYVPLTKNVLPVRGLAKLCLLSTMCTNYIPMPFTQPTGDGTGVEGVGVGGLVTAGGIGALRISVEAAPWTLYTATVTVMTAGGGSAAVTSAGFVRGAFSYTGSTGQPGGSLQLVTPVRITSNQGNNMAGFVRLGVRFVPEPGWLVLLASGCLGLGLLHRFKSRP